MTQRKPKDRSGSNEAWACWLLVAAVFAAFLRTTCPSVHWLDGGELTSSLFHLVPGHAPGQPVHVVLGKLVALFPVGSIAFRANLLSGVCTTAAAYLLYKVAREWTGGSNAPPAVRATVLLVSVVPLLSYPVWIQSVRAEVYSLHLLISVMASSAALKAGVAKRGGLEVRWLMTSAFLFALDFGVHTLLSLLVFLPVAGLALARRSAWRPVLWAKVLAAALMGASCYLLLPIRGRVHPGHGWGAPDSWTGFLDILLARSFQDNFSAPGSSLVFHNSQAVWGSLVTYVGPLGMAAATGGLLLACYRRRFREVVLGVALLVANAWSILPQNKVFIDNPDFLGYLAVSYVILWSFVGYAMVSAARWLSQARSRLAAMAPIVLLGIATGPLLVSATSADRSADYLARTHGLTGLKRLPPGATLRVSGNDTTFVLQYLQDVENVRPDVDVLPRSLLTHGWYRARFSQPEAWARAAVGTAEELAPWVLPNALRLELRADDLPFATDLCPSPGPGWGYYDVGGCLEALTRRDRPRLQGLLTYAGVLRGPQAATVGLNAGVLLAQYYRAIGQPEWAAAQLAELRTILPGVRWSSIELQ